MRKFLLTLATIAALYPQQAAAGSFVTKEDGPQGSLSGHTIALWQSHGRYFDQAENRWQWQRARLLGTVEDLYTQSYVLPFLAPMLENAGAYVMSPRERDTSPYEIIADADHGHATGHYSEHSAGRNHWHDTPVPGFGYSKSMLEDGDNPFLMGGARMASTTTDPDHLSTASWNADIPTSGDYAIYVSYASLPESTSDARYTVRSARGEEHFTIDQRKGGGTWIYLGHFPLEKGRSDIPVVELSNLSATQEKNVVTADAVKIGGGMGNVARRSPGGEYTVSGKPRFTEGARYWLQWAGMPDSVYSSTEGENDYNDDFRCRGLWVNYLLGGSERLPDAPGLGIPVDMALAFHSDAGLQGGDSIVGTMGIYCTERGRKFADGRPRALSRRLTDSVVTSVVRDIRLLHEPDWTRRKMRDRSYAEARIPQVPSVLIELLSHQNPADMRYGLDPAFRFDVSRAVYKGILRYFAAMEGKKAIVQPLPVRSFAINRGSASGEYILSWQPSIDPLEPTALPDSYLIYERINDGAFRLHSRSEYPIAVVNVSDSRIYSYRIVAVNKGGHSFPSETLALCDVDLGRPCVTVVNGFTRISAPATIEAGLSGFDYMADSGVPYLTDIAYTGPQTEFRREVPFVTNDAPGFGASRAIYEDTPLAGNSFDNVFTHGSAIAAAGYPFVSSSLDAFIADTLSTPPVVDLILGKQKEITPGRGAKGTRFRTYPALLLSRLSGLAARGSSIMVSGSYIASDLWDNPSATADDRLAVSSILGYRWHASKATATGTVSEIPSCFTQFQPAEYRFNQAPSPDCYAVESPDAISPADSRGAIIMRYTENGLPAATAFDAESYRTVAMGFPFETITAKRQQRLLMKQILDFLSR